MLLTSWLASVKNTITRGLSTRRRAKATRMRRAADRCEALESRAMLAFDFVAALKSPVGNDFIQPSQVLNEAPQEITLRFSPQAQVDPATLSGNISVTRSGRFGDAFGSGGAFADIPVSLGSIVVKDAPNRNEVTLRFSQPLVDDAYRITIDGTGTTPLVALTPGSTVGTTNREAFRQVGPVSGTAGVGQLYNFDFNLNLGAKVVAVVPQPVTRGGSGLAQAATQIDVYFNAEDPLNPSNSGGALDTSLYTLVNITDTTSSNPTSATYNATTGKVTLTFAAIPADKQYRLVIGQNVVTTVSNLAVESTDAVNSTFNGADDLGTLVNNQTLVKPGTISAQTPPGLTFPPYYGPTDEPGHRDLPGQEADENHGNPSAGQFPSVAFYTFDKLTSYGTDPQGNDLFNVITDAQMQRAREIFAILSYYTGTEYIEVPTAAGATSWVITGDTRAVDANIPPDNIAGINGGVLSVMNANSNWGSSEYGGSWFQTAFHEIGHGIGLDHAYDIPAIMGRVLTGEAVFPGDYDLIHARGLSPLTGSDIDTYKFAVPTTGDVTIDAAAVLAANATDFLDPVLTLYRETAPGQRVMVSRNDDLSGRNSKIQLKLDPGTYFVAVTAAGNTGFNPEVPDSGYGGRTRGRYNLSVNYAPDTNEANIRDNSSAGRELDGDRDGVAGGAYNFWFKTATNTLFVDKLAAAGGTGTLALPYNEVDVALAAATPGSIVRIVGNGGTDGNLATPADATPYLFGRTNDTVPVDLVDGATFNIPAGVTVMIDEGAVLKFNATVLDVGSSSGLNSRANAALQVLGTPSINVQFTSYSDDALGRDSDGTGPAVRGGQWGGLVFRADSDSATAGVFFNTVQQATIQYGGGQVNVDSKDDVFSPIHIVSSRPNVVFNTIRNNSDAAISADPNAFLDDQYRSGPDVFGNVLDLNSINGLLVRVKTDFGKPVDVLNVPARFQSRDITYVLTESLTIAGGTGGLQDVGGVRSEKALGRLQIDPGVVVKLRNSRIELERGRSQLIAEGTAEKPIIFTSLADQRFGAGAVGAFNTNGNLADIDPATSTITDQNGTRSAAGNWGGLIFNATSKGSLDNVYLAYAGGTTPIEGAVNQFNAIEVHQATFRLANSRLENNAGGLATGTRNGRGSNTASTVFVRGAQPVILKNDFRNNLGDAISINVNSLIEAKQGDTGRQTGTIGRNERYEDNAGPLVRENRFSYPDAANQSTSGMAVRTEEVTTENVWDDTDIVHIVRGDIRVRNFHTATGLRLQSSTTASLVVKMDGTTAGFTAEGFPLEIDDRIGGTVQIVGQPGYPVVITDLRDDTVGASFNLQGLPDKDTNNDGLSVGVAGSWRSVRLEQYSNDRNVGVYNEKEIPNLQGAERNGTISSAEDLGTLAPNDPNNVDDQLKGGDDNRRLGFEVHGVIAADTPADRDMYSFKAYGGSEVWIEIDKSSPSLDTVVELMRGDGTVYARSDNSQALDQTVVTATTNLTAAGLVKDRWEGGDYYTTNPKDAGMKLTLPGPLNALDTYFVRVRSRGTTVTSAGLSSGSYELRVRVNQRDDKPGSTVQFADIRYATNGVEALGLPLNSPITSNTREQNTDPGRLFGTLGSNIGTNVQELGNLLQANRSSLSVGGELANVSDVDWYTFSLNYDMIQVIGGLSDAAKTFSTIFDIDYADGISRPDTSIFVFDDLGRLIYVGRDSDVQDDQPAPGQGTDADDLSRGSFGKKDAYIGPVQLPTGNPTGFVPTLENPGPQTGGQPNNGGVGVRRYYVAIASDRQIPQALTGSLPAWQGAGTAAGGVLDPLVRLEPVSSIRRVVEDHIGHQGYSTGLPTGPSNRVPVSPGLFDISSHLNLQTNVTAFNLGDVPLYVATGGSVTVVNAMRGSAAGTTTVTSGLSGDVRDISFRSDGNLYAYERDSSGAQNIAGRLNRLDAGTGGSTTIGGDAITDAILGTNEVGALAWQRQTGRGLGQYDLYYAVTNGATSTLFRADPSNGSAAVVTNQPWGTRGTITNSGIGPFGGNTIGVVGGMQFARDNSTLYGVDSNGNFFTVNTGNAQATVLANVAGASFRGLALGPQNAYGGGTAITEDTPGFFRDMLFALDSGGNLRAFNLTGTLQSVFDSNNDGIADATSISTGIGGQGLAFSPVDINLWHPTTRRATDAGHGVTDPFDNSRDANRSRTITGGGLTYTGNESQGGASFYFGIEEQTDGVPPYFAGYDYGVAGVFPANAQYGSLTRDWHRDLTQSPSSALEIGNNYNVPGGAYGSLVTNSFSLEGYKATDMPALYFSYFLETEGAEGTVASQSMRDSARVFVSDDNGVTWNLLATNNSSRPAPGSAGLTTHELPNFASTSSDISTVANQRVQELVDNPTANGPWRQSRVDLRDFVGSSNLKLRFDFSTAGELNNTAQRNGVAVNGIGGPSGTTGQFTGNSNTRFTNNNFEGFYIDDIIIGFAERGEMVTNAPVNQTFVSPTVPNHSSVPQSPQTGAYQLEIRRGTEYGVQANGIFPSIIVYQEFDTNDRLVNNTNPTGAAAATDNFEAGSLSSRYHTSGGVNWRSNGDSPWAVVSGVGTAGGTNATQVAKAGTITANQQTKLEFTALTGPGAFSFDYAVDSESGFDYLSFYVDGVRVNRFSGAVNWTNFSTQVTSGFHTFTWIYSKDGSVDTGADTAWIDNILFQPPIVGSTQTVASVAAVNGNGIIGDKNVVRDQGQVLIANNIVRDFTGVGILVDAASRAIDGSRSPFQGGARNLPTRNNAVETGSSLERGLATGPVIANNLIYNLLGTASAGIQFSGDPSVAGTDPWAVIPYGRIVNNTVYGGTSSNAVNTGILVTDNAGPSVLNNTVVNFGSNAGQNGGVFVDASSLATTVVDTTAVQGAQIRNISGTNTLTIANGVQVFVNPLTGNFYPADGSPIIDSSLNSLQDRPAYKAVLSSVGMDEAPILAPDRDLFGQKRADDPNNPGSGGVGSSIFKDIGALERVDFTRPTVDFQVNRALGTTDTTPGFEFRADRSAGASTDPRLDSDLRDNFIRIEDKTAAQVTEFRLQLADIGIGIDKATVNASSFRIFRTPFVTPSNPNPVRRELISGQEYTVIFNENTNEVIFTAPATWRVGTYDIEVATPEVNWGTVTNPITIPRDLAGNGLLPNSSTVAGAIRFQIELKLQDPTLSAISNLTVWEDQGLVGTHSPDSYTPNSGLFVGASYPAIPVGFPAAPLPGDTAIMVVPLSGITAGGKVSNPPDAITYNNIETQPLRVTAVSSDPTVLTLVTPVTYISPNTTGSIQLVALPNQPISAPMTVTITVTVTDAGFNGVFNDDLSSDEPDDQSVTRTFQVLVLPRNDRPVITQPSNVNYAGIIPSGQVIGLAGIGAGGGENQPLRITAAVTGGTPGIVATPVGVNYTNGQTTGSLTLLPFSGTPAFGIAGTVQITVTVEDGGLDNDLSTVFDNGTTTRTFDVTFAPSNGNPNIDPIGDINHLGWQPPQTVTLSGIGDPNPAHNGSLRAQLLVTGTGGMFLSGPTLTFDQTTRTGRIDYQTRGDRNGTAVVTVRVFDSGVDLVPGNADDGVTERTFSIIQTGFNDAPVAGADTYPISPNLQLEDQPILIPIAQLLGNDAVANASPYTTTEVANPPAQTLTLVSVGNAVGGSVTINGSNVVFTPNANFNGTATFTYVVRDNAVTNFVNDFKTAAATVTITYTPVNDPPRRVTGPTTNVVNVRQDQTQVSMGLTNLSYSPGPTADETTQSLTYRVTALPNATLGKMTLSDGRTELFVGQVLTLGQLQGLQFRPAGLTTGTGNFVFTVQDNGGTANGGVDLLTETIQVNVNALDVSQIRKIRFLRSYNPSADYHFFTTNTLEFNAAISGGYQNEAVNQTGFALGYDPLPGAIPIYRLYNLETGRHYYTTSASERDFLVGLVPVTDPNYNRIGWRYELNEPFVYPVQVPGTVEIFRLYNQNSGVHLYVESAAIKDAVLASGGGVWQQHNSLGFAFPDPARTFIPPGPFFATAANSGASSAATAAPAVSAAVAPVETVFSATVTSDSPAVDRLVKTAVSAPVPAAATVAAPVVNDELDEESPTVTGDNTEDVDLFWSTIGSTLSSGLGVPLTDLE